MKQKTSVRVGGKDVTLISEDDPAYLRRVAAYVDRKMTDIMLSTRMPQPAAATLCAIELGDELMRAQDENQRLRREVKRLRGENLPQGEES